MVVRVRHAGLSGQLRSSQRVLQTLMAGTSPAKTKYNIGIFRVSRALRARPE
jgi:hypothetical protein